ncbi:MAG: sigma-70 family RNA polymerase sigma factor [Nibricoccus sp.]
MNSAPSRASDELVQLMTERKAALRRLLARMASEADADDLLQETWLKAARAWPKFRGDSDPATWLHRIAQNAALDHLKSRRNREAMKTETIPEKDSCAEFVEPAVRTMNIETAEMHGCVREYIERLPAAHREVLELKDLRGLTSRECAEHIGISLETAKIRLHRARAALRRELEEGCEFYQRETGDLACDRRDSRHVSFDLEISSKQVTPESGAQCSDPEGRNSNNEKIMSSSSSNCCAPMECAAPASSAAASGSQFTAIAAEFVALGAAIGANCELCLRHHTAEALKVGISIEDIARAIEMAEKVKATPAQLMRRLAERLVKNGGREAEPAASPAGGCGCG